MPRNSAEPAKKGKKASPKVVPMVVEKVKKPYPSHDERIIMADKEIQHWEALNQKRRDLVATTEKTLAERQQTLAKSESELAKAVAWKQRLTEIAEGKPSGKKMKYNELIKAMEASGKSVDDLITELRGA